MWKLGKLNHVAIAVPDLEKAAAMYRDVLGAKVSDAHVSVARIKQHQNYNSNKLP